MQATAIIREVCTEKWAEKAVETRETESGE
jgi:hypothetical protein